MISIASAIIKKKDKILIAKRKNVGVAGGKWEFPGGKKEQGETLKDCLRRELQEELDITGYVHDLIVDEILVYNDGQYHVFAYDVDYISGDLVLHDHDEIRWVAPNELMKYEFSGNAKPFAHRLSVNY